MDKKAAQPGIILLAVVMVVAIGALVATHADPAQTLIGMLIGVFVIAVIVNGGKKRILLKKLGPEIQQEISEGKSFKAPISEQVISLIKAGKKSEASKALSQFNGMSGNDLSAIIDEIQLRIEMGQRIEVLKD